MLTSHSLVKSIAYTITLVVAAVTGMVLFGSGSTQGLSGSEFQAGRIIDDPVFHNATTMDANAIQAFLNSKVPVCDTNGTQPIYGTTRAAYGASQGYPAPYICLKDYTEAISGVTNGPTDYCTGSVGAGTKSAAQIISEVSVACGINPQTLLVLLQKEQALVTDDWPWPTQYQKATGYGCPDTAPCNEEYFGFFNQVYQAAQAFNRYAANPTSYNYRASATNFIYYNPNLGGCGGSNVYIENQATASLYIYTPYQPNQAALNNLYGTGDSCSAYGNRNFWRMFNDWFGTTLSSYFLRTPENGTVYLVTDDDKFPISDPNLISALYPLGGISYVNQAYLDTKTTGQLLKRLILSPGGTVYFYDAGIKLSFSSCAAIAHYGLTCGDAVLLTQIQIDSLVTGPAMTRFFGTQTGKSFYIDSGQKREVLDTQSLTENGLSGSFNVLNESAIANLAYGTPVIRDEVVIKSRSLQKRCFQLTSDGCYELSYTMSTQTVFSTYDSGFIDEESYVNLSIQSPITGFVRDSANNRYALDAQGKVLLTNPTEWVSSYVLLPDSVIASIPDSTQPLNNLLVKSSSNGTVYFIEGQQKRTVNNWNDLVALNVTPFVINTLSDKTIASIPTGVSIIAPGSLVKYANNGTVYLVDGLNKKIPITTFLVPVQMGVSMQVATASNAKLDHYTTDTNNLGVQIRCEGVNYGANTWALYEVEASAQTHYGFTYQTLDDRTCANLSKSTNKLNRFVRVHSGTIYYIDSGEKRPIGGWGTYLSLGGNSTNTVNASEFLMDYLPTGSTL